MKYLWLTAAATLILCACGSKKDKPEAPTTPDIEVAQVLVDSVVLHKTYPGFLEAEKRVDVVARVNGNLTGKSYTDGAQVTRGQRLFTIDSSTYSNALSEIEAQLTTARSSRDYARSHYEAVKKAQAYDAVSHMEVLQAESALHQAEAQVRQAEAQLRDARLNMGYCNITAPVSGRITAATVQPGAYVSGEGAPFTLATIYDDRTLNAVFAIEDAQHIRMLRDEQTQRGIDYSAVPLAFEQPLSRQYTATLNYVAPDIDSSTGTLRLKAKVDNPQGELRDGMYCTATVPYGFKP